MKRIFSTLLIATFITSSMGSFQVQATDSVPVAATDIPSSEDEFYTVTVIEEEDTSPFYSTLATTKYVTKTKTTYMENVDHENLWSVSITATFAYDGTTATCTSYTPSAKSYNSSYKIQSVTGSKSGNTATATATAVRLFPSGSTATYTKSVTIKCSPTGVVS